MPNWMILETDGKMKMLKNIITLVVLGLVAGACSSPTGVDVDDLNESEEQIAKFYEVQIYFPRIRVIRDCDALSVDGEFAYDIFLSRKNGDGSWQRAQTIEKSADYGDWNGKKYSRKEGESIELDILTSIPVKEGDAYRINFAAIEWDGLSRDPDMDGDRVIYEDIADGSAPSLTKNLVIGDSDDDCAIVLPVPMDETLIVDERSPRPSQS